MECTTREIKEFLLILPIVFRFSISVPLADVVTNALMASPWQEPKDSAGKAIDRFFVPEATSSNVSVDKSNSTTCYVRFFE